MTGPEGLLPDAAPLPVALYVHVPFCRSKCAYCDFASSVEDPSRYGAFVDAVLFEAGHWSHYDLLDDVVSVYFGGGTPTALGDELVRLLAGLRETAHIRAGAEITVETNPDTTDAALVEALVRSGSNRFSLGVQSFDDDVLRFLGRRHDAARAEEAAGVLRASGMPFSVDLMCGIPTQTVDSWRESLRRAIATGASHLSVYPLSVEQGTPLAELTDAGMLAEPDPDSAAEMMTIAEDVLLEAGFERYETANYARPGARARHNLVYWTGGAYLGLGPSAASMLPAEEFARVSEAEGWTRPRPAGLGLSAAPPQYARARFTQRRETLAYLRQPLSAIDEVEYLDAAEAAREDIMLGIRLADGVADAGVRAADLAQIFESLESDGLVERFAVHGELRWRTTRQGWLLGNEVFGRIWSPE